MNTQVRIFEKDGFLAMLKVEENLAGKHEGMICLRNTFEDANKALVAYQTASTNAVSDGWKILWEGTPQYG